MRSEEQPAMSYCWKLARTGRGLGGGHGALPNQGKGVCIKTKSDPIFSFFD